MNDTDTLRILRKPNIVHVTCLPILFTPPLTAAFCKREAAIPPPQCFPYKFAPRIIKQLKNRSKLKKKKTKQPACAIARRWNKVVGRAGRAARPDGAAPRPSTHPPGLPLRPRTHPEAEAAPTLPATAPGSQRGQARRKLPSSPREGDRESPDPLQRPPRRRSTAAAGPTYRPGGLCPGPALLPAALLPHVGRGGAQLTPRYPGGSVRPGEEAEGRGGRNGASGGSGGPKHRRPRPRQPLRPPPLPCWAPTVQGPGHVTPPA